MKAIVCDDKLNVLQLSTVNFDKDLPKFGTDHGVWVNDLEVTAPSVMFAAALDLTLNNLLAGGCDFSEIIAVSGSGQQHGSVYWKNGARKSIQNLNPEDSLEPQLKHLFSVEAGPIWMDSSTTEYCRKLEEKVGGAEKVAEISGSRAYERFTGNQIQKVYATQPDVYESTERISLVSSMLATMLCGDYAPIDVSDGSGMNLLDIKTRDWSNELLEATAPHLLAKLGPVASSEAIAGSIDSYFVQKYGFSEQCQVITCSGDNPCSLAGLKVSTPGDICISLGTSDTLFGVFSEARPATEGHLLCSPVHQDAYMPLLCFKNGSVVREKFRDLTVGDDWQKFNEALLSTPAGNNGNIGFFFEEPEIIPANLQGIHRFNSKGETVEMFDDIGTELRALVEGQFMNMRSHAEQLGLDKSNRIIATGGASKNYTILQVISDIFGAPVYVAQSGPETATLGAALRAMHGYQCAQSGKFIPFQDICESIPGSYDLVASPNSDNHAVYTSLLPKRDELERSLVQSVQASSN